MAGHSHRVGTITETGGRDGSGVGCDAITRFDDGQAVECQRQVSLAQTRRRRPWSYLPFERSLTPSAEESRYGAPRDDDNPFVMCSDEHSGHEGSVVEVYIGAGILWFVLMVTLGVLTLRKGHWVMFILGLVLPLFWLIGALIPARRSV